MYVYFLFIYAYIYIERDVYLHIVLNLKYYIREHPDPRTWGTAC